jgi:alpha-D-ribose 1-methylphosphonate 5-triphosphate synthase subunit PhnL
MMHALEIEGLRKSYVQHGHGGLRSEVLRGVSLELEQGTCTVVRGASGSGKTTLLRCVYRSALSDAGAILVRHDGIMRDLVSADERAVLDVRAKTMALATQFLSVVPRVSAIDLVVARGCSAEQAQGLLERLGLSRALHDLTPATFSGGQRQMLNLALTLARDRSLLLLDEITASLDPRRRRQIYDELVEAKRRGACMLAVFHDLPEHPDLVDRVITMQEGRLCA